MRADLLSLSLHSNLVCVCNAVCPEETVAWVNCFRAAVRKNQKGVDYATITNCDEQRRKLDECTQRAVSQLLHAAIIPGSTGPGSREEINLSSPTVPGL